MSMVAVSDTVHGDSRKALKPVLVKRMAGIQKRLRMVAAVEAVFIL
ncbi:hypothetical protein MO867_05615 [Microbulbifer sp. OS29]|uniref:Uncharacterized protein n=1 Tax=Microbulbifer okhotskensis TaxID=2926617 RepID=A0A9X2EKC3_9GAMM|nr:hypothetical protein [Microbulbifer okhotskensis]MCO1333814.1 hypothetical protein [Microbulbifer okhotskensis]